MKRNLTPSDIPALIENIPQLKNYSLDEIDFGKSYVGDGWAWAFSKDESIPKGWEIYSEQFDETWHLIGFYAAEIEPLRYEFWSWFMNFEQVQLLCDASNMTEEQDGVFADLEIPIDETEEYFFTSSDAVKWFFEDVYGE